MKKKIFLTSIIILSIGFVGANLSNGQSVTYSSNTTFQPNDTALYEIEIAGGQGGDGASGTSSWAGNGGNGGVLKGNISLAKNENLSIKIGKQGNKGQASDSSSTGSRTGGPGYKKGGDTGEAVNGQYGDWATGSSGGGATGVEIKNTSEIVGVAGGGGGNGVAYCNSAGSSGGAGGGGGNGGGINEGSISNDGGSETHYGDGTSSITIEGNTYNIGGNGGYVDCNSGGGKDGDPGSAQPSSLLRDTSVTNGGNTGDGYVTITKIGSRPYYNSTKVSPDPPLFGSSTNYSTQFSDPEGNIDNVSLDVDFKGNSVYSRTHNWFDGFERNGSLSETDPFKWNKIVGSGSSDDFTVNNTRSWTGSQSLRMERTAGEGSSYIWTERDNKNDISSRNFTAYAYDNGDNVRANLGIGNFDEGTQQFNGGAVFANIRATDIIIGSIDTGGSIVAYESGPETVQGNWYRIEMDIYPDKDYALVSIVNMTDGAVHQSENISIGSAFSSADDTVMGSSAPASGTGTAWMDDTTVETNFTETSFNQTYTPNSDGWLNATINVTDNQGASKTTEINRYLANNPPNITINKPGNTTFYDYNTNYEINVDTTNDSNPGETFNCDIYSNQNLKDTNTGTGQETKTGSYNQDLATSIPFTASCSDTGGTKNKTQYYTVENFGYTTLSSSNTAYETVNEQFNTQANIGDMVNQVNYTLYYDGKKQDKKTVSYNSKKLPDSQNLFHDIPFVPSDGTNKNWKIQSRIDYNQLGGGKNTETDNSSSQTQTVDQAFQFGNHSFVDGTTQLEGSNLEYTASLDNRTSKAQANIEVESEWKQNNQKEILLETNAPYEYENTFNTDFINSNTASFDMETTTNLSFQGDSRTFSDTQSVTLQKIRLTKSGGEEALKFWTKDEENGTGIKSRKEIGLKVSNPDQPSKTRFYGFEFNNSINDSVNINPGDAEVLVNAYKNNTIEYQDSTNDFSLRRHFLIEETVNNQTTVVPLYLLPVDESTNIIFEVIDEQFEPVEGYIVRVERDFPAEEEFTNVAMFRTGSEGKGSVNINPNQQYRFQIFNTEGELVEIIGPQEITSTQQTLQIDTTTEPSIGTLINDVRISNINAQETNLSVSYSSQTEKLNNITLEVRKDNQFENTLIDSDTSTDRVGTLFVDGFNTSQESVYYEIRGTFGENVVVLDSGSVGSLTTPYGSTGIFLSLLVFITLTFAGLWRPIAAIGLGTVSIVMMSPMVLNLMPLTSSGLIALVALGAVLVWRMS